VENNVMGLFERFGPRGTLGNKILNILGIARDDIVRKSVQNFLVKSHGLWQCWSLSLGTFYLSTIDH
jgi:hypothetical protein